MFNPIYLKRAGPTALALCAVLAVLPAAAQAAPVNLATVGPFAVLSGAAVTNTGPSVLNGDLGVAPGTSLSGFGFPAVVNGATHDNDAVAAQAQLDLIAAYDVAAGQPIPPANDLTGIDLGGLQLGAGAYRFTSSAQLTGTLTLDAAGDPSAQFVFEIGSTLTTASASSVVLINGASPCNVHWQVGSSATLGTTTAFQGNLMALSDISVNNGTTVLGRLLARNGQVSLINTVIDRSMCGTSNTPPSVTPPTGTPSATVPPAASTSTPPTTSQRPPASQTTVRTRNGSAVLRRTDSTTGGACTDGFTATVSGRQIRRVVFRLDGRRVAGRRSGTRFRVNVRGLPGRHTVTARVTFKDATRARTLRRAYRACAAVAFHPRSGPSQFTG